ncbi:3'-5' exonuclease [Sphingobacterium sp. LRF_L2]|uniref:3'-5' exonuclease n=1 Tax=Sphingobacterium sp. LRF_L2 TaxID=3369421 RepID=UPI003F5F281D
MIDIETLGTRPYSVILTVAAVRFDSKTGIVGDTFYDRISVKNSLENEFVTDADTLKWWGTQPSETMREAFCGESSVENAMVGLMDFVGDNSDTRVWANSPSFDLSLIRNACERLLIHVQWNYGQERDVRTLSNLNPEIRYTVPFVGNKHDALADCRHQIKYLVATLKTLSK